jgi:hypothetical protein
VTDVMGDDQLQREGGDALWNSVRHALKPGVVRYYLTLRSAVLARHCVLWSTLIRLILFYPILFNFVLYSGHLSCLVL